MIIRTKMQLIKYVKEHLPTAYKSIHRALEEGTIVLLGGFNSIPPSGRPGWIVKIISARKYRWYLAVITANNFIQSYRIYTIKNVPWEEWVGGSDPLCAGEQPTIASMIKRMRLRRNGR